MPDERELGERSTKLRGSSEAQGDSSVGTGVFACCGEYWSIGYGSQRFSLKDIKGLGYIQRLLRHPGQEFHALDLLSGADQRSNSEEIANSDRAILLSTPGVSVGGLGDAGEMLDAKAKKNYKHRLLELAEQLEDLRERGDYDGAERVESEIDFLEREITRAFGLGGRERRAGSAAERARLSVTRAIKAALLKVAEHHPTLGELLAHSVRTGSFCRYRPQPCNPVAWRFSLEGLPAPGRDDALPATLFGREASFLRVLTQGTAFVGRQAERARLRRLLELALDRQGGVCIIGGAPGVGKTRIAAEIGVEASRKGFLTLFGSCYDRDDSVPFVPFVEILEEALARAPSPEAFRDSLGNEAAEIARLLPQLRRLLPDIPAPLQLPPDQSRRVLFSAIAEALAHMSGNRPMLLLLDDLHWADEGTLLLLNHLAQLVPNRRVLIVGTYRDSELDPARALAGALDELIRRRLVDRIGLSGLPQPAVGEMLRALSGREPPDTIVDVVYSETEGNPFFAEELFRHLMEQGKLTDSTGEFRRNLKLGETDVPPTLRLVIGRRLARLSESTRQALGVAAIIGRSFTFELLEASTRADPDSLLNSLEEAEKAGLISAAVQHPEARFRFSHELIREVVVSSLSGPRRQRLHLDVADAIERVHPDALEEQANDLAHHVWQAGTGADPTRTVRYLAMAAKRAREQGALSQAEEHYQRGLSLLATMPEAPARDRQELELRLALGQVSIATRGYTATETTQAYDRASALGERLGDPMQVVLVLTGLSGVPLVRGEMAATEALADRIRAAGERSGAPPALVWGYFMQGVASYHRGDLMRAWDCLGQAVAVYREEDHQTNPQDPGAESLQYLALTSWQMGLADSARTRMREAIALVERLGKPYALAHNRLFAGYLYALLRDPCSAQRFSQELVELAREQPIPVLFDLGRIVHGWSLAEQGHFVEGIAYARDGVTSFMAAGNRIAIGSFLGLLAQIQARGGAISDALATVEDGLAAAPDQLVDHPELLWLRGEMLLKKAAEEPAEQSFRHAIGLASRLGAKSSALRTAVSFGHFLKSRGRSAEARDLIAPLWKTFVEGFDTRDLVEAKSLLNDLG